MVMRPEPWGEALDELFGQPPHDYARPLILLTPSGRTFTQALAQELAAEEHLIIACGRYEGIDARVARDAAGRMRVDELSIGDYVLNGGEAAALVVVEAVARLLPGVIGNPESLHRDHTPPTTRACWRARSTPSHRTGGASTCRRCCSAATTPGSPNGVGSRPWPALCSTGRTCCRRAWRAW